MWFVPNLFIYGKLNRLLLVRRVHHCLLARSYHVEDSAESWHEDVLRAAHNRHEFLQLALVALVRPKTLLVSK